MQYPTLAPADMSPRQREVADEINAKRVGGLSGPYAALIYSPEVADRAYQIGEHLRFGLRVPERLRALAVVRTAARHNNADADCFIKRRDILESGLADDKIRALAAGRRPANMKPDEEMVYDFVTQLTANGHVKAELYDRLAKNLGREICLELTAVCGYTAFLTTVINVTETPFPAE